MVDDVSKCFDSEGRRKMLTCAKNAIFQYVQRGFMMAINMGEMEVSPQEANTIHTTGMRLTK